MAVGERKYLEKIIELNDRRYTEVNIEKEKALKIKEEADKVALSLAREIQTYKDEAHNGLLKQWQGERGTYVTTDKFDAIVKPLINYMNSQQGRGTGLTQFWGVLVAVVGILIAILTRFIK